MVIELVVVKDEVPVVIQPVVEVDDEEDPVPSDGSEILVSYGNIKNVDMRKNKNKTTEASM